MPECDTLHCLISSTSSLCSFGSNWKTCNTTSNKPRLAFTRWCD